MALRLVGSQITKRDADDDESYEETRRRASENQLVRQMDLMMYTSETQREKVYKKNWVTEVERMYNLVETTNAVPSFRPRVLVPELQFQMLAEASDLSDLSPLPYIVNKKDGQRDEDREKAVQAQWRAKDFNLALLNANLWALYAGNGYLRVGYDSEGQNGMGEVVLTAPHPASVHPDPFASSDEDLKYVMYEEFMYINEVRKRWPENGFRVHHHRPGAPSTLDTTLHMPEGPMSAISGLPGASDSAGSHSADEARVRVRTLFVRDYAVKSVNRPAKSGNVLLLPNRVPAYPDGRLIVECEGVILLDRPNPFPMKLFPHVTIHGLPPLTNFFAPPTVKYTIDLQKLAERMLTQCFENAIRINNCITYIYEDSGIDIEEYGGIPGGVHEIAAGSKPPEQKMPQAFPQHMMDMPMKLLDLVKELNGFTPSRKGMPGAGNLSAPLFDSSVLQAQSLTRLRSRFLAKSVRRLSWIVFATMGRFYTQQRNFPSFYSDDDGMKYQSIGWDPLDLDDDLVNYELQVDENSIRPFSQVTQRMLVPLLRQMGMIDVETGLERLEIPDAEKIKARLAKEAQAAAAHAAATGQKPKAGGKRK